MFTLPPPPPPFLGSCLLFSSCPKVATPAAGWVTGEGDCANEEEEEEHY